MDADNFEKLFNEMVASQIHSNSTGFVELPLDALRELHDLIGLEQNQSCTIDFSLSGGQDGLYNYCVIDVPIGTSCEVVDITFYDQDADESVSIDGGELLYKAITRDFLRGTSLVSGYLVVDQDGGLYIESSYSDDIGASFYVRMPSNTEGMLFVSEDLGRSIRVWSDANKLYIAPSYIFFYDGLPM